MQILYCDDCGIRVDEGQESANQKVYCANCAPKHAAELKAQSSKRPSRQSTRAPGSGIVRIAPGTKSTHIAPPPAPSANYQNEQRDTSQGLAGWFNENKPMAIAAGAAAAVIVGVLVWMLLPNGKAQPRPNVSNIPDIKPPPDKITQPSPPKPPEKLPEPKPPEPPPKPPAPEPFNAVHDSAKRRLEGIHAKIASGKFNAYEVRKELEWFMGTQLKNTPMQAEAAKLLEKFKEEKLPPDKAEGAQPGLVAAIGFPKGAELFGTDFKALETRPLKMIHFPDAAAIKEAFGRDADFAAQVSGFIEVPRDGAYSFYLSSDDGSSLYIGSALLINHAGSHAFIERDGTIDLKAGKHAFHVDYYQGTGAAGLSLSWSGPGLPRDIIPAAAYSAVPKK